MFSVCEEAQSPKQLVSFWQSCSPIPKEVKVQLRAVSISFLQKVVIINTFVDQGVDFNIRVKIMSVVNLKTH